jgi:membrane-associated phospholipid phosphatase
LQRNNEDGKKFILTILLLLTGIGTAIVFLYLFTELAEDMLESEVKLLDETVIHFFNRIQSETLDQIMFFFTEMGSVWFLTLFSISTILVLWKKQNDKWGILFFIIGIGGGGLLTKLLKVYYGRERPSINEEIDAIGYSFPSGHSMGSLIFYGFIAYFVFRSAGKKYVKWTAAILAAILIVFIAISRIYLGAHYPSDVIAGYLAGGIWLILCILAMEWVRFQTAHSIKPIKAFRRFLEHQLK